MLTLTSTGSAASRYASLVNCDPGSVFAMSVARRPALNARSHARMQKSLSSVLEISQWRTLRPGNGEWTTLVDLGPNRLVVLRQAFGVSQILDRGE